MTTIFPDIQTTVLNTLSEIKERIAKLEERTDWSKTLVVTIFAGIIGGLAWSGLQQHQLGELSEANRNNAAQIAKLITAVDQQTKDLTKIASMVEQQSKDLAKLTAAMVSYSPQYTRTITQCGTFSPKTKVANRENVYRWPMLFSINPSDVRNIWAGVETPIPGVALKAQIVEGGKFCEVEIVTDDPAGLAPKLEGGIVGCMSITLIGSHVDPTPDPYTPDVPELPDTFPKSE